MSTSMRAFELVPVIEKLQFFEEKTRVTIESMECCARHLYLGTNDSFIIQYLVEEVLQSSGKLSFSCKKLAYKYLGLKKPIVVIKAASALNRILVVCDTNLILINMLDLEPVFISPRIKGVHSFCVNENPIGSSPFSVQVCIARKKQLAIYNITESKAALVKEISLPEAPITLAMDGKYVCAALATQYVIINCEQGSVQDLFPYNILTTTPLVKRIGKEEFLLNSPGALGMFVTTAGISERPPIHWFENLCSFAYSRPYILSLDENFISIFSILDQQMKQNLQFQGGRLIGNFDGNLYVASAGSVYSLIPVPWEKQVQTLISEERIDEALELAKHANHSGLSKEQYLKVYQRIQQQAGFIALSRFNFDEALELFQSSHLDVRELISLYPKILPASSLFTRTVPLLHHIADVCQMCRGKEELIIDCKKFLVRYLQQVGHCRYTQQWQLELNTALLKIYADLNLEELTTLIVSSGNSYALNESADWLEQHGRFNALALHYHHHDDNEKCLGIWFKILNGELQDESFKGVSFLSDFLTNLTDYDLLWKYADKLFEYDAHEAVKIFTERTDADFPERLNPGVVLDYLCRYPNAVVTYLEFLVYDKQMEKEKFHTHLALIYLDNILEIQALANVDMKELALARNKFQTFLQTSSVYRVQLILGKIENTDLRFELAILFGKLEEHEKALRILVHELNDPKAANHYCSKNSSCKDKTYKHNLFYVLLSVYLDESITVERQQELLIYAIELLNHDDAEFDIIKVLRLIPHHWSVCIVEQFFYRALRAFQFSQRNKRLKHHLNRGANVQVQFAKYDLIREAIIVTEDRICATCCRPFTTPEVVFQSSGMLTHAQCFIDPNNDKNS